MFTGSTTETCTTCPYCGVGCGVIASVGHDQCSVEIRGDEDHPANFGRLCSKGLALGDTLGLDDRLLYPHVDGARVSWEQALDAVSDGLRSTIDAHGPDSVAFYVSGQLLTEDYYVANKLMKGFIGSANIDTNSRLCMASSVVGHKRAFGADTVPGTYRDLEEADLIIMVGSNFAWCHPVLHQRVLAAKARRGTRLVVIDPRETATTAAADLHMPIKPGTDVALFNWLFWRLSCSSAFDQAFTDNHTKGLKPALLKACAVDDASVSDLTGLSYPLLEQFLDLVVTNEKLVTVYSQGVNQSVAGTDKVNAILNCHLVTGRIGKPGAGPFSITGQPNAMGGREVGGLANQLAAHMDFSPEDIDRVERFWNAPNMVSKPGLKAVDLFDAVAAGQVKAIWIMATNPVVSMPQAEKVRDALEACPLVIVSDISESSDTVSLADVALPATGWGEKNGTVTNSERRISRQRAFLPAPGDARHDWQIICDVARRMGYSGFAYETAADIYREHAALSGYENKGQRDFDIGGHADLSDHAYDDLAPVQWPVIDRESNNPGVRDEHGDHRFFSDGAFFTGDQRARFVATPFKRTKKSTSRHRPLVLNTGRVRDHWHTMTRTGNSPRLSSHMAEPFLELNPSDARTYGIADATLVRVRSFYGESILRALVTNRISVGQVFAPIHWTRRFSSAGCVDVLVGPQTDPHSGQPDSKFTPVRIMPLEPKWYACGVFDAEPDKAVLDQLDYWALAKIENGWLAEFAGSSAAGDFVNRLFSGEDCCEINVANGGQRIAMFEKGRLTTCVYVAPGAPVAVDRSWLARQLSAPHDQLERFRLLAGRPPSGAETGAIICACHGVGVGSIRSAIVEGSDTLVSIGQVTCAGTNCGSCKPEIMALIEEAKKILSVAAE
ncbi:MAG: molybdopterin-dependent oxidoreductase [Pseudomonadota bacterium]